MTDFKDIEAIWHNQSDQSDMADAKDIEQKAKAHLRQSARLHRTNIIIFGATLLSLVVFVITPIGLHSASSQLGIVAMISILALRMLLEIWSRIKLRRIGIDTGSHAYATQMLNFYSWRQRLSGGVSASMAVIYVAGFALLLPEFAKSMSNWAFYLIVIGFSILAFIITRLAIKATKREMSHLRSIKNAVMSLK